MDKIICFRIYIRCNEYLCHFTSLYIYDYNPQVNYINQFLIGRVEYTLDTLLSRFKDIYVLPDMTMLLYTLVSKHVIFMYII